MANTLYGQKTVFHTAITDVKDTDIEGLGVIRIEGNKAYRWMKNNTGRTLNAGDVVCYAYANAESYYEYMEPPIAANANTFAGILMGTTVADDYYAWVQIEGYNETARFYRTNSAVSVGDALAVETCATDSTAASKTPYFRLYAAGNSATIASVSATNVVQSIAFNYIDAGRVYACETAATTNTSSNINLGVFLRCRNI